MTTFYYLRFVAPPTGGPGPCIYIPYEQGGAVILPGTVFDSIPTIELFVISTLHQPNRKCRFQQCLLLCSPIRWLETGSSIVACVFVAE
jgi:hypothetical protein